MNYLKELKKVNKNLENFPLYKMDKERKVLKKAFNLAFKNKLFSLYLYEQPLQEKLKLKLLSTLTSKSGALGFLSIQILAANAIMNKNKFSKKDYYFKKKCGIAINHLRSNITHVNATKVDKGYMLNGNLTWASGYKIFDTLLVGFHFDNKEYEVMTTFKKEKGFEIISRPETFVGYSLGTVNIKLNDYFVKDEDIVSSNEIGNYNKNKSLSKTIQYTLYGISKGVIKEIDNIDFKKEANKRVKSLKNKIVNSTNGQELNKLRVELFNLVQEITTKAIILKGGKSILSDSNLQRYYQELIMFNANGLNQNIKDLFIESFHQNK